MDSLTRYSIYVIQNEAGKRYIGYTSDLEKRLKRHNGDLPNKTTSYTRKNRGHWTLKYKEEYASRQEALRREKELKSCQGRKFITEILSGR
ncbi:MAG: GIY-YIG nuclease family protein [Candidatus Moranbacteria bacterium]|nr:GIY-YIG nuclease family protein [Candidatus Moranbacteria bacterium]NTW89328.1 GIY-YIG nuclease family protein [Candidatus Moranbacteria bacterium]